MFLRQLLTVRSQVSKTNSVVNMMTQGVRFKHVITMPIILDAKVSDSIPTTKCTCLCGS